MDWLNLHTAVLDSPEFVGAEPIDRATWLCLLRFCIGQENGGTIADCAGWTDRRWQQQCRVTLKEVQRVASLWSWVDGRLSVFFYPMDKQREVQAQRDFAADNAVRGRIGGSAVSEAKRQAARENGRRGGRKPTGLGSGVANLSSDNPSGNPSQTQATSTNGTDWNRSENQNLEGKGREGNGREARAREENPSTPVSQAASPPRDLDDPETRWPYVRREPWARDLAAVLGAKIGKTNWPEWRRLVELRGVAPVVAAAAAMHPDHRWPDRVEAHLVENPPPPPPEPLPPDVQLGHALVAEHGWQRCLAVLRIPNVPDHETMLRALAENPALARKLASVLTSADGAAGAA